MIQSKGYLEIPKVTMLGEEAFYNTKLTGLDLSKATSLDLRSTLRTFPKLPGFVSLGLECREPSRTFQVLSKLLDYNLHLSEAKGTRGWFLIILVTTCVLGCFEL